MDLVSADGWISDESSFWGDEDLKAEYELRDEERKLTDACYESITQWQREIVARRSTQATSSSTTVRSKSPATISEEAHVSKGAKRIEMTTVRQSDGPTLDDEALQTGRSGAEQEAADLSSVVSASGVSAMRQQNESMAEFFKRCPVTSTETAKLGPWLWVRDFYGPSSEADVVTFQTRLSPMTKTYLAEKSRLESDGTNKAPATVTRLLKSYRTVLEDAIMDLAVETNTLSGKWMLFPTAPELERSWQAVAGAVAKGQLGPVCKVATQTSYSSKSETLICVYTNDFRDLPDIKRVLEKLVDLVIWDPLGKPIYYKADAYTYADLSSDNEFRIRASLYSSTEILAPEDSLAGEAIKEGPVGRLKSRSKKS